MKSIIWILGLILFIASCNSPQKTTTAKTVKDKEPIFKFVDSDELMPVLEMANNKKKLVFIDFYATWCLPCKMMDEDVFTNKNIAQFFDKNFVNLKIDGEKGNGPNLVSLYQINVYPTLLFLDSNGKVLVKKEGAAYHSELRSLAEQALSLQETNTGD